MQAAVIRETGWTVANYRNQPADDIFDLLRHMSEQPPTHRILAWRYELKPARKSAATTQRQSPAPTSALQDQEVAEVARSLGSGAQPITPEIREMARWAQEQLELRTRKK